MQSKPTLDTIKLSLLCKNLNIKRWAEKNHFSYHHTLKVIHRYAEKPQIPQSPLVFNILSQLETDTGVNLMEKGE